MSMYPRPQRMCRHAFHHLCKSQHAGAHGIAGQVSSLLEKVFEKARSQETAIGTITQQNVALQLNIQNLFTVMTAQNAFTVDLIATVKDQAAKVQRLELLLVDISNEVMRWAPSWLIFRMHPAHPHPLCTR